MPRLELTLLGMLKLTLDGKPLCIRNVKEQALLIYMVVEKSRPCSRRVLGELLWDNDKVNGSLRTALSHVRKALGGSQFLRAPSDAVEFAPEMDCVSDVATFVKLLDACRSHPHRGLDRCRQCAARMEQAVAMYHADFLSGFPFCSEDFEEWRRDKVGDLQRRVIDALRNLAAYYARCNRLDEARRALERLLKIDPGHTGVRRNLDRLDHLADEDGAESSARRAKIPIPLTPRVGRDTELALLDEWLSAPTHRFMTIIGPGGIGKTHLALTGAGLNEAHFEHGTCLVELAPVSSAEFLVTAIADALGFRFAGQQESRIQLLHHLRKKELLLVLDNFEHLLAGVPLVKELVEGAPGLTVLATSREHLGLPGEWVIDLQELSIALAVDLFIMHAQRLHVQIESLEDRECVKEICHMVGGMPLAIELAAAWVRSLAVQEIAQELGQGLRLLATTAHGFPERHRNIQAVFDQSWKLLSAAEQRAFVTLAVFQGGFTGEAAAQVADAPGGILSALVEKSLLRRSSHGRYSMHELVRRYAQERFEADPDGVASARERHARYYTDLLSSRLEDLQGRNQSTAIAELRAESENLRRAWRHAVAQSHVDQIERSMEPLFWLYERCSMFHEGREVFMWTAETLSAGSDSSSGDAVRDKVRGRMLIGAGWFQLHLGQLRKARELVTRGHQLLQQVGARLETAMAMQHLGTIAWLLGDFTAAQGWLGESIALAREAEDRLWISATLGALGLVNHTLGRYAEAKALIMEALNLEASGPFRDAGMLARGRAFLGFTLCALGQASEAQQDLQHALSVSQAMGDRWTAMICMTSLGLAELLLDRPSEARRRWKEALTLGEACGDHRCMAIALCLLGDLDRSRGAQREAKESLRRALHHAWQFEAFPVVLDVLVCAATLLMELGDPGRAYVLLGAIRHHDDSCSKQTRDQAEGLLTSLHGALPPEESSRRLEHGRTLPLEQLVRDLIVEL